MSRERKLGVILLSVGFLAGWFFWKKAGEHPGKQLASEVEAQIASNPASPTQSQAAPPIPATGPMPSFEVQQKRFTAAFHTPITFYGRVMDQHSQPVAQADVKLSANDKPLGGPTAEYARKTDANGFFSIKGISGLTLFVKVSKPGYFVMPQTDSRKVTSSALFEYGLESIRGPHRPDKDAPVIFTLHKQGVSEPLVKIGEKNFRMARDGTPLAISVDQQGGSHQVILRCWNKDLQRPQGQRQYDWRLEISVPNGGLMQRKDAFDFEAPEGGYLPNDTVDMPASLPQNQWHGFAERAYFIRFEDGTFARAKLEMQAGGDHFVVWESFYNPKAGSPNLESPAADQSAAR